MVFPTKKVPEYLSELTEVLIDVSNQAANATQTEFTFYKSISKSKLELLAFSFDRSTPIAYTSTYKNLSYHLHSL
jgi:hypothetical protein